MSLFSIATYLPMLTRGALLTLTSFGIAISLSLCLGFFLGTLGCKQISRSSLLKFISGSVTMYSFILRGIPAYIQILIAYFVLPTFIGVNLSAFWAGTLALALCSSGYVAAIVRGGLDAVPQGQWDAAYILGYPIHQALFKIIFPQSLRYILPALFGECEQLLKSTSLLATIGATELTRTGMNILSRELAPLPIYGSIACIYLLFSVLLQLLNYLVKQKVLRHD